MRTPVLTQRDEPSLCQVETLSFSRKAQRSETHKKPLKYLYL
jgi:hypothetical protein